MGNDKLDSNYYKQPTVLGIKFDPLKSYELVEDTTIKSGPDSGLTDTTLYTTTESGGQKVIKPRKIKEVDTSTIDFIVDLIKDYKKRNNESLDEIIAKIIILTQYECREEESDFYEKIKYEAAIMLAKKGK